MMCLGLNVPFHHMKYSFMDFLTDSVIDLSFGCRLNIAAPADPAAAAALVKGPVARPSESLSGLSGRQESAASR